MLCLDELHEVLDEHRASPDLARIARTLGLSVRSLQRRLREHGTSFVREVERARVRHAQKLMTAGALPLSRIALDAGFTSPGRLSIAFRKVEGTTPSAWRRSRQATEPLAPSEKKNAATCRLRATRRDLSCRRADQERRPCRARPFSDGVAS